MMWLTKKMKSDGSYIICGILQDYEVQYDDVILYV